MHDFAFAVAASRHEALAALAQPDTLLVAGGTELLNWMRLGITAPERVIDIGRLRADEPVRRDGDRLTIDALASLNAVGEHPLVRDHAAVLAQACLKAASAQVRHRATLGGNVLQKTRCAYFRSESPLPWGCNKREPGSGCAARDGLNDRHAIFGWTDACVATQPSDPAVALACLDVEVEVEGPRGRRMLPMPMFHLTQQEAADASAAAGDTGSASGEATLEHRLAADEMIVAYHLALRDGERSAYVKVRERESYEYALVSAAAAVEIGDGRLQRVRLALGSVAQKPWRLPPAESALVGAPARRDDVLPAIRAALADARPLAHNAYKIELAAQAAARAIVEAGAK
jgi:xanthine dehydrogenase YagS FAD-binding subunit